MRGVRRLFSLSLLRPRDVARDVDDEIAFHLEMRARRLRERGLPADRADRLARERFGDVDEIRRALLHDDHLTARRERSFMMLAEIARDARFAARSLLRAPAFTLAVVGTLALGIGANATIFSVIDSVVLKPVRGVADVDQLFAMSDVVSYPELTDLRAALPAVRLAGMGYRNVALGTGQDGSTGTAAMVSGDFFEVVGVRAAIGRVLTTADDVPGAPAIGVLGHGYWTSAFGADPGVVGRTVVVNGVPVTVVGVAPASFRGLQVGARPEIWMPVNAWTLVAPPSRRPTQIDNPGWSWLGVIGKRPADGSFTQVEGALVSALRALDPATTREAAVERAAVQPIQAAALPRDSRGAAVTFAGVLAVVVGLVLLAACANITGLMLSRAAHREREIGVRVALGASRGRLVRQLLTEALMLAAAGGVAGLAAFVAARGALRAATFPGAIPGDALGLAFDARLMWFVGGLTVLAGMLVGLLPALQATRGDVHASIRGTGVLGRGGRQWLRGALVTAQVTVAIVLIVGTGLFTRALGRALAVDLGFRPEPLAIVALDPTLGRIAPAAQGTYLTRVAERVAAVPGVRDVTWTRAVPLTGDIDQERVEVPGFTPPPGERMRLETNAVGARYHEIVGIPLVRGRGFTDADGPGAPMVMVINQTAAERWFAGRDAVGSFIKMRGTDVLVVGVVKDAKYHEMSEEPRAYAYLAAAQVVANGDFSRPSLVVRTEGVPAGHLPAITAAVRAVEPAVPVLRAGAMTERIDEILAPQRAGAWLLGVFGMLALAVASVGIYGVVAYSVSRRTREIGIRMALGARRAEVLRLVVGASLGFVAVGVPVGLALAVMLARGMESFLFGLGAVDPPTLATAAIVILLVGLVAALVPARHATRVNPVLALREEG